MKVLNEELLVYSNMVFSLSTQSAKTLSYRGDSQVYLSNINRQVCGQLFPFFIAVLSNS